MTFNHQRVVQLSFDAYYRIRKFAREETKMRLILPVLVLACVLGLAGRALAESGAQIFTRLDCAMCHKPDKKTAAISLKQMVKTYSNKEKLLKFFNGEARPLIESDNWGMMRARLPKIKALPEQDKEALAEYLLSFK